MPSIDWIGKAAVERVGELCVGMSGGMVNVIIHPCYSPMFLEIRGEQFMKPDLFAISVFATGIPLTTFCPCVGREGAMSPPVQK